MRAGIRWDVLVQRPTTIKALCTAADITDTGSRPAGGDPPSGNDALLSSHVTELRAMFIGMQQMTSGGPSQPTDNGARTLGDQ